MPVKFKNRWGYGAVAFLGAMAVLPLLIFIFVVFNGTSSQSSPSFKMDGFFVYFVYSGFIGIHAAISAMICWPFRTKRTTARMVLAGVFTVVLTFVLMEFSITLFQEGFDFSLFMFNPVLWVMLGSIFTFGVPYLLGIFLSMLFIDWPSDI